MGGNLMYFNKEKKCFVNDDGSKLKDSRSLIERYGNCAEYMTQTQRNCWLSYLVKELYGLSPRPREKV